MDKTIYCLLLFFLINISNQRPLSQTSSELHPESHQTEIEINQLYHSDGCQTTVSVTEPSEFSIQYVQDDSLLDGGASVYDHVSLVTDRIRRDASSDVIEIFGIAIAKNFTAWRIQRHRIFNGTSHIFHSVSSIKIKLVSPKCNDLNRHDEENSLNHEGWNGKLVVSVFHLNCSLPDKPEFGNINGPYGQNGTIEFECVSNFVLHGRKYLSCVQNESGVYDWDDLAPKCVQDTCPVNEVYEPKVNSNQIIASPGYPRNLTRNRTCSWKLIPKENHYCIDVRINDINLPPNNKTYFGISEIAENSSERNVFSSSSSSFRNKHTLTTCNKGLAIYYRSNNNDDGGQYRGVYLWYTVRPDTTRYTTERYRTSHQPNVSQDAVAPTKSTTDSGGSKSGIIAAGVVVPLLFIILVIGIIFYVWYRKKYPVRMIIGKDFGKFTNPAYEKRNSTATLTREHDSFDKEIERMAAATGVAHDNPVDLSDETDFHREYQPMTTQTTLLRNMGYTRSFGLTDDGCNRDILTYNSTTKRKMIHPDIDIKDDKEEMSEDEADGLSNFSRDIENQLENVEEEYDEFTVTSVEKSGDNSSSESDDISNGESFNDSDEESFKPFKDQPNVRRKRVSAYLNEVLDRQISENYTADDSSQSQEQIVDETQNESSVPEEDENDRETNKRTDEVDEDETRGINPEDVYILNDDDVFIYENAVIVGDSKMDKPVILPFPFEDATDADIETTTVEDNREHRKCIESQHIELDDSGEESASSADSSVPDDEPNSYSFNVEENDSNIPEKPEEEFIEDKDEYSLEEQFPLSEDLGKEEHGLPDSEENVTKTLDTELMQINEEAAIGHKLDISQSTKILNDQHNDNLLFESDIQDIIQSTKISNDQNNDNLLLESDSQDISQSTKILNDQHNDNLLLESDIQDISQSTKISNDQNNDNLLLESDSQDISQSTKISNDQNNDNLLLESDSGDVDDKTIIGTKTPDFKTLSSYPSVSLDGGSMESLASVEYAEFERSDLELPPHTAKVSFSSKGDVLEELLPTDVSDFTMNGVSEFFPDDGHLFDLAENTDEKLFGDTNAEQNSPQLFSLINNKDDVMTVEDDKSSVTASEGASSNTTDSTEESNSKDVDFAVNEQNDDDETTSQDSKRNASFYDETNHFDSIPSDPNQVLSSSSRLQKLILEVPTLGSEEDCAAVELNEQSSSKEGKSDDDGDGDGDGDGGGDGESFDSRGQLLTVSHNQRQNVTLDNSNFDLLNMSQYLKSTSSKTDEPSEKVILGMPQSVTLDNPTCDVTNTPLAKPADDTLRVIRVDPFVNDNTSSSNSSDGESESDTESENIHKQNYNEQDDLFSGFGESTDDAAMSLSLDQNKMDEINGIKIIPAVNLMDLRNPAKKGKDDSDESDVSINSDILKEAGISSDSDSDPTLTSSNVRKQSSFKITLSPELHSGDNDSVDV